MARTIKVTVLFALATLVVALLGLGGKMPDWLTWSLVALLALAWIAVALWPSHEAILDRLLRSGDAAREEIVQRELDEDAAQVVYDAWYGDALKRIKARFPAYVDDFIVRDEPHPEGYSGQMTVIRRLVAKLGVLKEARRHHSG